MCLCVQSCPTLCNSIDCSPLGSSAHGIFQPRILVQVAIPTPGVLPNSGIKHASLVSPSLGFTNLEKKKKIYVCIKKG